MCSRPGRDERADGTELGGIRKTPVEQRDCRRRLRFRATHSGDEESAAFEAAACIGCGACVAACPNASAMLFMGAKVTHLGELPQGQPERYARVVKMVAQHDHEGFGGCTNTGACADACPKEIPLDVINTLNRDLLGALRQGR